MKFLVTWKIPTDKWHQVLKTFTSMSTKERADAGPGVKIVGRWHDVSGRSGVAIFETDDLAAMQRYSLRWNPHMELTITPVVDDEESVPIYRQLVGDGKA